MATGIVLSIDAAGDTGSVQVDETNEILPFRDSAFPSSGLAVNSPCTFTVETDPANPKLFYATNLKGLAVPVPPPTTITGPFTGDVTVNAGEVATITGAAAIVNGNLILNGGKIIVEQNAQVTGTLHTITDGILVVRKGGQIKGSVGIESGGSLKVVNKGQVKGNIAINQAGRVIIGNENGPGFINGTIDIFRIRKFSVTIDSKINA